MKIGDEVYIHGYIDEIRIDTVIIKNDGGYFVTVEPEVVLNQPELCEDAVSRKAVRHSLCKAVHKDEPIPCENQTASCLSRRAGVCDYVREIDALPPVTPQPKIEERTAESAQNVLDDDSISRKAVIDLWDKYYPYISVKAAEFDCMLRKLPSAQPEYYDYSDIEPLWESFAEENDINLTSTAKQLKDAMWCGYRKGKAEIIRCKECKHYKFADNRAFGFPVKRCEWTGFEDVDDDDFCSRAERGNDELGDS